MRLTLLAGLALAAGVPARGGPVSQGTSEQETSEARKLVCWIPIDDGPEAIPGGMMDMFTAYFIRRQVDAAKEAGASVVVFHIRTFGGQVHATMNIVKAIRAARPIPTVAFVDDWALSAGALITIACDRIYMERESTIGAAQGVTQTPEGEVKPVLEKTATALRAFFRAEVERRAGRSEFPESVTAVAEAMTDPEVEVLLVEIDGEERFVRRSQLSGKEEEGLTFKGKGVKILRTAIAKGKLLTMTAKEAYETYGFIDGVVAGREELLGVIGHADAAVIEKLASWPEEIARFLSGVFISGLLLSVAMLGLLMELWSPGKGIGGLIFLFGIGLFFWSHAFAGEASGVEIVLFLVGVGLLGLEVFVIPGFGVAGFAGIGLVVMSLVLSFIPGSVFSPAVEGVPFPWGRLQISLLVVLGALGAAAVALVAFAHYMGRVPLFKHLVLAKAEEREESEAEKAEAARLPGDLAGRRAVALTDLRPAGKVELGDRAIDAVADGEFIEKGDRVEVYRVEGNRVVVTRVSGGGP